MSRGLSTSFLLTMLWMLTNVYSFQMWPNLRGRMQKRPYLHNYHRSSQRKHIYTRAHTHVFTLKRACRRSRCQVRASEEISARGCRNILILSDLKQIKAKCSITSVRKLEKSYRFDSITKDASLHLLSIIPREGANVNKTTSIFEKVVNAHFTTDGRIKVVDNEKHTTFRLPLRKPRSCTKNDGKGVTVYVVDTGCRNSHIELRGRIGSSVAAPETGYGSGRDGHGHGTHVAATVGGRKVGVTRKARIVCIKALSDENEGAAGSVASGLEHALQMHKRRKRRFGNAEKGIVSVSLGVRAPPRFEILDNAVRKCREEGMVVVTAAGNEGGNACLFSPARVDDAITVAATDNRGRLAEFSNFGPCVDAGALGVSVWSATAHWDTTYGSSSGTSMATPFISGIVALALGEFDSEGQETTSVIRSWLKEIAEESRMEKYDKTHAQLVTLDGFCKWVEKKHENEMKRFR